MNYMANEALPKTMPAIVCHGPEDYRLEEWKVPQPAAMLVHNRSKLLAERPQRFVPIPARNFPRLLSRMNGFFKRRG